MMTALLVGLAVVVALGTIARAPARTPRPAVTALARASGEARRRLPLPERRLVLALLAVGGVLTLGLVPVAALIVALLAAPRARRLVEQRATKRSIEAALPAAIEMLILVVQAGLTPHQAIHVLAERAPIPVRPGFAGVRHRVERGAALADGLQALPATLGPGATALADTLAMAERHGTPIARTLEQLALDVRERRRRHAEAEARKLPIRMAFPLVTCTLPAFVLVAIVPAVLAALKSLGDTGF